MHSGLIGAGLLAAAMAAAQTPIYLNVSVVDSRGESVTGIPQSDFQVFENGVEQPIAIFRYGEIPVSMGFAVDSSGSMRRHMRATQVALRGLWEALMFGDEAFRIDFSDRIYLDQNLTPDLARLEEAMRTVDYRGESAVRDAIGESIARLRKSGKWEKKILVTLTDGDDNSSHESLDRIVREAQQSGVVIYAIGMTEGEKKRDAKEAKTALRALAEASGGRDFYPKNLDQVEDATAEISREIRNQYLIAYSPANPALDGTFRKIEVRVKGYGNPNVRTRSGYWATAEAAPKSAAARAR